MRDLSGQNFGYLIAYGLPGFLIVWSLSEHSPTFRAWLATDPASAPTVGGFLYVTLAAIGAGLIASTVRWLVLDAVHHATGIRPNKWKFANLGSRASAFEYLVEIHYRYYQFHGNAMVALLIAYGARRLSSAPPAFGWFDASSIVLEWLLFLGSRDCLRKYYSRVGDMLSANR